MCVRVCMYVYIYMMLPYISIHDCVDFWRKMASIFLSHWASSNIMCNEAFPENKHTPCLFRGVKQSHIQILKILWKLICFSHVANRRRLHINNTKNPVSLWYCARTHTYICISFLISLCFYRTHSSSRNDANSSLKHRKRSFMHGFLQNRLKTVCSCIGSLVMISAMFLYRF